MYYFDSDVQIGKFGRKHTQIPWSKEQILEIMDQVGISAALVHSGTAIVDSAKYGNEELYQMIKDEPRLYGCYTVIPNMVDEFYEPAEMIADMRAKDMVAARIFPASYCFSTAEAYFGGYLSALEEAGFPLLVYTEEITEDALEEILLNHPKLNVIWQHRSWSAERKTLPMVKRFPNLYVDMANNQASCAIEYYPSNQVVFGSHLPFASAGAARSYVDYARLTREEKEAIAGGTLARLCGITPGKEYPVCGDEIALQASRGEPLSALVFDSHTHIMEPGGNVGGRFMMYHGDKKQVEEVFRLMGVDAYVVAPWHGIWTDTDAGNDTMLDIVQEGGDIRAYGYVMMNPTYGDNVAEKADYYHNQLRIPGLKMFYNRSGIRYNDPIYDPWWEIANKNKLFALLDYGGYPSYLADVADIAERYPDVSLFLDHTGRSFEAAQGDIPLAKKYPNVYLQITYTSVPQGMMEYFCKEGVADRVMYGTDVPMRDARPQMGWVAYANISVEDKKLILGGNMQRVLERCFTD